jgi:BMFP domain-containing protein YqiC
MQTESPLISDFVKLLNSAAGTLAGMGREGREAARERAREFFGGLDFVSREEFEAVKAMAATAREKAEALEARLALLEAGAASGATDRGTTTDPTAGISD